MSLASLPAIAARDVPVATAAQMAEVDRVASEQFDVPLDALMESAARQIAAATRAMLGGVAGRRIAAVTGSGNNGGDALGALRHLRAWGADVAAYVAASRERMRPLARQQYDGQP